MLSVSSDDDDDEDDEDGVMSPVTVWVGVTPAHHAAQSILVLLKDHQITDVDIDFRESIYMREAGPQLCRLVRDFDPLVDVLSPLTPALGLGIINRLEAQGTMALYLAEGDGSDRLLGLTCRHDVLISDKEVNRPYTYHPHGPRRSVCLLGERAFASLIRSIKARIGRHSVGIELWKRQIEEYKVMEQDPGGSDVEGVKTDRIKTEQLVVEADVAMDALAKLLDRVVHDCTSPRSRVLGHVSHSPQLALGVEPHGSLKTMVSSKSTVRS